MPFGMKSGRTIAQTPISVPLGLSSTQDFPPLVAPQTPTAPKPQRKSAAANVVSPAIKPVVPVLFAQASRDSTHTKSSQATYTSDKSNDPLDDLTTTNMEHQVAGLSVKTKAKPKTSATDFLTSQRTKILNKSTLATEPQSTKFLPTQSKLDSKSDSGLKLKTFEKSVEKRQHPGKLDMAAAKEASKKEMDSAAVNSAQTKSDDLNSNAIAVSRPSTPATAVSQNSGSSATRQVQSRTIRVLPTNKAETLPRLPPASPSTMSAAPSIFNKKQPSRRGSFTSVQLPSTPVSERISDNASYTSASISRASSPPPSKIGSAPVRQVTKSQQKKERQARAKLAEEKIKTVEGPSKALVEEPVQAPILGRKKKAKKAATKNTADSTPTATRSSSPTPKDNVVQQYLEYAPATPPNEDKKETAKSLKERSEFEVPASPGRSSSHGDFQKKGTLTATAVMASFQKSTDFSATIFEMFKGINHRVELTQDDITESTTDPILSSAQIRRINDGEVIVVNKANNRPIVVLPDHSLLHGLSAEQAERYLYLREQIISTPASVAFHSNGREMDRYVHAAPHPTANGSTPNKSGDIDNVFDAPTLSQTAATVSIPPYWSTAPLKSENMLRRGPPRSLEEAEQNMLEADQAWIASRKETEAIEKKLNTLIKKNRKLFLGSMQ